MPDALLTAIKESTAEGKLDHLFSEHLGWDHFSDSTSVEAAGQRWPLRGIAKKAGFLVYQCGPGPDGRIPESAVRRRIDHQLGKLHAERMVIFTNGDASDQVWHFKAGRSGRATRTARIAETRFTRGVHGGDALAQRVQQLHVSIDEEFAGIDTADVSRRVHSALDVEKVTKRFYEAYRKRHQEFAARITGIDDEENRNWYASVTLNRLMFTWFIQKRRFLAGDPDYLRTKLEQNRYRGNGAFFLTFYRHFLIRLFHDGLGAPETERDADLRALIGDVPYLNGGLFAEHHLEAAYPDIDIPDAAFDEVFAFFDQYQWRLDESGTRADDEIDPDVLGYIFEKYINQKQMGAYYTKEDITGYIGRNTIIPAVFDKARERCSVAFQPDSALWRLLRDAPDYYIYPAVRHGVDLPLPAEIAAGLDDVSQRGGWNAAAPEEYALPTETWRELVARRQRCQELRAKLAAGEVHAIDDLITLNLDIEEFAQDAIELAEGSDLVKAFAEALRATTVLDPTCGSGAFLFAALNILQPLYDAALQRMQEFVDDADQAGHPRKHEEFRKELARIEQHPNRTYFILKEIILNNLFGVDIMEEAVEICKLRLFLKLAAEVEDARRIEPLPDIDFNIRAGNTLVGFVSIEEVQRTMQPDSRGQTRLVSQEEVNTVRLIEEQAQIVSATSIQFRNQQQQHKVDSSEIAKTKAELTLRLKVLNEQLNQLMRQGGRALDSGPNTSRTEKELKQPLHWFADFYQEMSASGFDCIVGNPPYVPMKKIDYWFPLRSDYKFPDIYGYMVLRWTELAAKSGRIGMVVPMSLCFSSDYAPLRSKAIGRTSGWLSSYDILPSPLFNGVAQRCTIWVSTPKQTGSICTSRMHRWRSVNRVNLFPVIQHWPLSKSPEFTEYGIPKHGFGESQTVLNAIEQARRSPKQRTMMSATKVSSSIGYAPAALNFVSAYLTSPPLLDGASLQDLPADRPNWLPISSDRLAYVALSGLLGELYLWYWLTRGDGFDVTKWIITDFLEAVDSFPEVIVDRLSQVGRLLDLRRNEALVFKHHAAKYVGNFNYRGLSSLTRRADLLFMAGLGLNKAESLSIFDYIQRVLAINVFAGEKGIPAEVKARYPVTKIDQQEQRSILEEVDTFLVNRFGFTEAELRHLFDEEVQYRTGGEQL